MSHVPAQLVNGCNDLVTTSLRLPGVCHDAAAGLVGLALEHLSCDEVAITTRKRNGMLTTIASSSPAVHRLEGLQQSFGEGPTLRDAEHDASVLAADLADDGRWPRWGAAALELGLTRVVSSRLSDHTGTNRVLNLYSRSKPLMRQDELELVRLFSDEASVVLQVTQAVWHLGRTVDHRTVIGQAQGLLMERFEIDADQAISVLKRISSHTNRRLYAVAADLVSSRELTGPSAPAPGRTDPPGPT